MTPISERLEDTVPDSSPARRLTPGLVGGAAALDAVLVIVFAAIGRGSHAREATLAGLCETAWPFLAGLGVIWVLSFAWRRPLAPLRTGVPVWIGTVALGFGFRALAGQGTAFAFVIVATLTLCLLLVGWRLLALALRGLAARRSA